MARKGPSKHLARLTVPASLPVKGKKQNMWLSMPRPGPHKKHESITLLVLLRDVIGIAKNAYEAKNAIKSGFVLVDGRRVNDERIPIGLMDVIAFPAEKKAYEMVIRKGKMVPVQHEAKHQKLCKVVGKHTIAGGKTVLTLHDGRNCLADDKISVGDSVTFDFVGKKITAVHKLAPGCRCLVVDGKHAGAVAELESVLERKGSMGNDAKMKGETGEFITALKYLFVVDEKFKQ